MGVECKVIDLPDRGEGGDYVDFCAAGGSVEELLDLIEAAPLYAPQQSEPTSVTPERAFQILRFQDLKNLPKRSWLIRHLLHTGITSVLSADSGCFKSFIALLMALCVATGRAFLGREVKQGVVVYVAAEGFYTLWDRANAWAQAHGCDLPDNFYIVKVPVDVANDSILRDFIASIEAVSPVLIILDTLSQCAAGANENDNGAMSLFVGGMMELAQKLDAHVMVLHHNAKSTGTYRGAGAIKANVDAMISLERPEGDDQNTVIMRCEKQRGRPFDPLTLRGYEVTLTDEDEYGDPVTSLVFDECDDVALTQSKKHPNSKKADATRSRLLEVFDQVAAGHGGVKIGTWLAAVREASPPVCSDSSFWSHRKILESEGEIEECGNHNGSPLYRRGGSTPTTPTWSSQSQGQNPDALHSNNSNNPLGVGVVGVARGRDDQPESLFDELPVTPNRPRTYSASPNALSEPAAYRTSEGEVAQ